MPMNKFQQKVLLKCIARVDEFPREVQRNIRYLRDLYDNLGDDWTPDAKQNKMINSLTTEIGRLRQVAPKGHGFDQKSAKEREDFRLGEDSQEPLDPFKDLGYM